MVPCRQARPPVVKQCNAERTHDDWVADIWYCQVMTAIYVRVETGINPYMLLIRQQVPTSI